MTDVVAHASNRVPLWLKFAYTAFVMVLVPVYWHYYGPTNFLYFCDVALLTGLAAIWLENPLLASAPAVGILLPQALWAVDFVGAAAGMPRRGLSLNERGLNETFGYPQRAPASGRFATAV